MRTTSTMPLLGSINVGVVNVYRKHVGKQKMIGNYISPAKNVYGASLPCPNNHPDIVEKRKGERVYPEYEGVSNEFRMLFRVPTGMSISEVFKIINPIIER